MPHTETPFQGVVTTIAAKCRRCYNCVRSCPAKAIRVQSGQAHVIEERCIGCGNCIKVCAQNAKQVEPAGEHVLRMLAEDTPTVAILAPSYAAAYETFSAGQVVGALRALGFDSVLEVGFGADLVATEYARLLKRSSGDPVISSPCPALVTYIEKYMPDLVPYLAPVVSPMIALGRVVKQEYVPGANVVFIGPCIAKKAELRDPPVAGATDAALTFLELDELLENVDLTGVEPSVADDPLPQYGALFPVSGGLLKAAAIQADLMDDSIVVVEGPDRCIAALQDLREGRFSARFLDALLCEGCIAGPGFSNNKSPLARREAVTAHVRSLQSERRKSRIAAKRAAKTDLTRTFCLPALHETRPTETEVRDILAQTNKHGEADELNCGACGYATCRDKALAVHQGLAEVEMCLPYLIDQLQVNIEKLVRSKGEIEKAREVATRAQQLASMGELAANLAAEINKPLGNIAVYAQLLRDQMPENDNRREDLATIIAEGLHCRRVLSGLKNFARQLHPQLESAQLDDIVAAAIEELRPAIEAADAVVTRSLPPHLPDIVTDRAQLTRVLVNVITNSLEALARTNSDGGGTIGIEAVMNEETNKLDVVIRDNAGGIEPKLLPRLFQPFVTTKSSPGAGLGLAVAHGIVHAHGGEIDVRSEPGKGAAITLHLPLDIAPAASREATKVLVVDDDPDFLEQHRIMLDGMGFHVITAERTDEALEISNREIPDAFVLDLMMEHTDSGARLSRALRRDPRFRSAPVVLLTSVVNDTGFEFSRNPEEVLDWMKADAWFDKPAPVAELANTLHRLLEQKSQPPPDDENAAQPGVKDDPATGA